MQHYMIQRHRYSPDWTTWACRFVFAYPLGCRSPFEGVPQATRTEGDDFLDVLHSQAREAANAVQRQGEVRDFSEAVKGVASRLMGAVERQLQIHRGKTPVCFLSGGWDSRAIAACLAQLLPADAFRVYTTSYDNGTTREELYASGVARALGLRHEVVALSPDYYIRHAADTFEYCGYATDMHVWMAEFLAKLSLPPDTVNFDGYAGDILLRCLLQQAADNDRFPEDESFYQRLAIIDPALALATPIANTFARLAREALTTELSRYSRKHRMLHFLLDNRGNRGVGHALRLQARSMAVAVPFLDPALFAYVLTIDDSMRFRGDFYPNVLAALDPRLQDLPSTNDVPLASGWDNVPIFKHSPDTLAWFNKNFSTAGESPNACGGLLDWYSFSPQRHKLREDRDPSYRRHRLRSLEMLNLFVLWHNRHAESLRMTPVLDATYEAGKYTSWRFPALAIETEYQTTARRYVEKAKSFAEAKLHFHLTMDVEAFPVADIHGYHTATCQLIDRLIFSDFGFGSDIDALLHQNKIPCTYFLEPYLSVWSDSTRFAEAVNFFSRPWSEIGLHCHAFSLPQTMLEAFGLKPGWCCDSAALERVLRDGRQRITGVSGEKVEAYRAGRLDIYPDFEKAVGNAGFSIDSSFAEGRDAWHFNFSPKNLNNGVQRYGDLVEIPVTAYRTHGKPGILDFNGSSFEEVCFVVTRALEIGLPAVTMLMHSWSLSSLHEYPCLAKGFHYASSPLWREKLMRILDFLHDLKQVRLATLGETAALGKKMFTRSSASDIVFPPPALCLLARREGRKVMGKCVLADTGQFKSPEFAFYLLVNGKKRAERWYEKSAEASFPWPKQVTLHDVALQGFVREADDPEGTSMLYVIQPICHGK